jgi:hypothetical protein
MMEVTTATWIVALSGLGLILLLSGLQLVAVVRPSPQQVDDRERLRRVTG